MAHRRTFSREFKQQAVERMRRSGNVSALATELGVRRQKLYEWRDALERPAAPERKSKAAKPKAAAPAADPAAQWRRIAADLALEVRFLKSALQHIEQRQPKAGTVSAKVSGKPSKPNTSSKATS